MTAHATTATSTSACAVRPGQKEDHAMTAATDTAPAVVSLETLDERRARIDAEDARLEPGYYAERFDGEERCLNENLASSVDAILDRVARRADGSLDLERLARLTVAAALQIDHHIGDHEANPWWERLA